MGRRLMVAGVACVAATLSGCGDEGPTEVGSGLIGQQLRTFEVVLDADEFLLADTTFDELGHLRSAPFLLLANDFDGSLDAHALMRIRVPDEANWTDEGGASHTDSIVSFQGARVTLLLDSLSQVGNPIDVDLLPLTESWDAATVTWELRYDTAGVSEPWTVPGGTTGPVAASESWGPGTDTLIIEVDSAAAAVWQDSAAAHHGALLRSATAGSRMRIRSLTFEFLVVPSSAEDTVVTAGSAFPFRMIADTEPATPPGGELRVGGLPTWRSLLQFAELEDLTVPWAPGLAPECEVPLSDATINLAALLLQPVPGGAFRLETPTGFTGRAVLEAPTVPLSRSPLSAVLGQTESTVSIDRFTTAPPDDDPVQLPITLYVRRLLDPPSGDERLPWLALTAGAEGNSFGYATFASLESATPPRLRLLLSVPTDELPCNAPD